MKRLISLVLACLVMLGGTCLAAQWPEGRSAAQPYSHLPEVNLSETMGYIMTFPRAKLPAIRFCDVLGMYLPREDVKVGEGMAHLYEKVEGEKDPVEVCSVDFSNPDNVVIRPMSETELNDLMWGGGTCVQMILPKSLEFGGKSHDYFVLMDEGCFTAADGKLKSISITDEAAWVPVIEGGYGISGMYYIDAELPEETPAVTVVEDDPLLNVEDGIILLDTDEDEDEGDEEAEDEDDEDDEDDGDVIIVDGKPMQAAPKATATPEPEPEPEPTEEPEEEKPVVPEDYVLDPDIGDKVRFDLVIGGDAKLAVVYSDNGSVDFEEIEFHESTSVEGTVIGEDVKWGVAFYDANDYIFDTIDISR